MYALTINSLDVQLLINSLAVDEVLLVSKSLGVEVARITRAFGVVLFVVVIAVTFAMAILRAVVVAIVQPIIFCKSGCTDA